MQQQPTTLTAVLDKKGHWRKNWKTRRFELDGNELRYFHDDGNEPSRKPRGASVVLAFTDIPDFYDGSTRKYRIDLHGTGGGLLSVAAPTAAGKSELLAHLVASAVPPRPLLAEEAIVQLDVEQEALNRARIARERTARERIELRDCKNVIELMDEVAHGKLAAALAAQDAGYFGGRGRFAQVIWFAMGVLATAIGIIPALLVVVGSISWAVFLKCGLWNLYFVAVSFFARSHYLYQLEQTVPVSDTSTTVVPPPLSDGSDIEMTVQAAVPPHGDTGSFTENPGAPVVNPAAAARTASDHEAEVHSGEADAERKRLKMAVKLGKLGELSLCSGLVCVVILVWWFYGYYIATDGGFNLSPFLPRKPEPLFVHFLSATLMSVVLLFLPMAWLVFRGDLKAAQYFIPIVFFGMGSCFFSSSFMTADRTSSIVLVVLGLTLMITSTFFPLYLRLKQHIASKDAKLLSDIAAYKRMWEDVKTAEQESIEFMEDLLDNDARFSQSGKKKDLGIFYNHGVTVTRTAFHLQTRATAEQLVVLLAQAWGLNRVFQDMADEWRLRTRSQSRQQLEQQEKAETTLLPKRRKRTIEKVWRGYRGDATRLRDLVRCSIVFDDIASLFAGLKLILGDDRIEVLRVKNRFAGEYDPTESCGYRDIQLNMVLKGCNFDEDQKELGLHEHICECQLHLACFYDQKDDLGHAAYVRFRNCRAE
jgi:hypothetical protein